MNNWLTYSPCPKASGGISKQTIAKPVNNAEKKMYQSFIWRFVWEMMGIGGGAGYTQNIKTPFIETLYVTRA